MEGDPNPYDIFDIPIEANINRLKLKITQTVDSLRNTNPYNLKLLKVSISLIPGACSFSDFLLQLNKVVPIGPGHSLVQRLADLGNINAYSRELSPEERVCMVFPELHSEDNLQIVVQHPREYCWLIVPYKQN